jgi:ribosomal-protein-alanine N-acetyltransferase
VTRLETPRLVLRPCTPGDVETLHAIWTDADVRRHLWDDKVIPRELAEEVVAATLADWASRSYGQFLLRLRDGGAAPIGFCGLRPASWCDAPELLFGLLPAYWGRGLATEAARAVIDDAFTRLNVSEIVAATDAPNHASVSVLGRVGMTEQRPGTLNGLDTRFFHLTRGG